MTTPTTDRAINNVKPSKATKRSQRRSLLPQRATSLKRLDGSFEDIKKLHHAHPFQHIGGEKVTKLGTSSRTGQSTETSHGDTHSIAAECNTLINTFVYGESSTYVVTGSSKLGKPIKEAAVPSPLYLPAGASNGINTNRIHAQPGPQSQACRTAKIIMADGLKDISYRPNPHTVQHLHVTGQNHHCVNVDPVPHQTVQVAKPKVLSIGPKANSMASTLQRPSFSTMQQHFSPKKRPRFRSMSHRGEAPSEESHVAKVSIEARDEMLHLHIIHCDSLSTQFQWQESAKRQLQRLFEGVATDYAELQCQEHDLQTKLNATALMAWRDNRTNGKVTGNLHVLSDTIAEVVALTDLQGQHTRVTEDFGYWYARACKVQQSRTQSTASSVAQATFVEGLGDGWKAETSLIKMKAAVLLCQLQDLGTAQLGSDLARLLQALKTSVQNILCELKTIQDIESRTTRHEQGWLQTSLKQIAIDVSNDISLPSVPDIEMT